MESILDKVGKGFLSEGRLHTPEVYGAKLELSGAPERDGFASKGLLFDFRMKQCLGLVSASHRDVITVEPGCRKWTPVSAHS